MKVICNEHDVDKCFIECKHLAAHEKNNSTYGPCTLWRICFDKGGSTRVRCEDVEE